MNLEAVEEQALKYLAQVGNPLVRIEVLYAHLRDHGLGAGLSLTGLRDFLSKHELVRVMEPAVPVEELEALRAGETAGVPSGAYVILATRVPSDRQLAMMMLEQLEAMEEALGVAKSEALNQADMAQANRIDAALHRIQSLRGKLARHGEARDEDDGGEDTEERPGNILDFPG